MNQLLFAMRSGNASWDNYPADLIVKEIAVLDYPHFQAGIEIYCSTVPGCPLTLDWRFYWLDWEKAVNSWIESMKFFALAHSESVDLGDWLCSWNEGALS